MARVFRHTYTKKLPDGTRKSATCRKWYIEYFDAGGSRRRVVGFTDKRATEALAAEFQRKVDREKAGIIDRESLNLSQQLGAKIDDHVIAYRLHLRASGASAWHLSETMRRLQSVLDACGFRQLADIRSESVQRWCELKTAEQMSARTRNTYTGSLRAFVRWCIKDRRLAADPLVTLNKADEHSDPRRVRRALSEQEILRLISAAKLRPLAEYGCPVLKKDPKEKKRKRDTWTRAELTADNIAEFAELAKKVLEKNPAFRDRLVAIGRERALIYKTLILTGLRKGELTQLRWSDLILDSPQSWLTVRAVVSKNGKEDVIPVRHDLAADLRKWRTERNNPDRAELVVNVPAGLSRILQRDLKAAGIDPIGVDVHSLRHTTATYLAKAGVAPRIAQALMRHSDIRLTLGTYTDPTALNTPTALGALPSFDGDDAREQLGATGTDEKLGVQLGVKLHTKGHLGASACAEKRKRGGGSSRSQLAADSEVSARIHRRASKRATRLERATFSLEG